MTEALSYFDGSVVGSQAGPFSAESRPTFSNEFMPLNPISYVPNRWMPVQKSVESLLGMIVISNRQGFDRATYYSIYNQLVELLQEVDQLDPDKQLPAQKAQNPVPPSAMMPCAPSDLVWPDRSSPSSTDLPQCLPLAFESPSFGSARMQQSPSPSPRSSRSINVGVSTPPTICISLPPHHQPAPTMIVHATQIQNPMAQHPNVVVMQSHQQHQQQLPQQVQQQPKVVVQPAPVKVKKQPSPRTPESPAVIKISSSDSSPTASPPTSSCALAGSGSTQQQAAKRSKQRKPRNLVCAQCGTSTTPEWRKGPSGDHSLCNACGLMYAKRLKKERLEMGLEPPPPRKRKDIHKMDPAVKEQPQQQQTLPPQHCDHPALLMDSPPVQLELQTHLEQLPNVELPSEPPLSPLMCLSGENSPINC